MYLIIILTLVCYLILHLKFIHLQICYNLLQILNYKQILMNDINSNKVYFSLL